MDKKNSDKMFNELLAVGEMTGAKMDRKKCLQPARVMEILGFIYDSILKVCSLSVSKQKKYILRIDQILSSTEVKPKNFEKLVGNLTYATWIAPFGIVEKFQVKLFLEISLKFSLEVSLKFHAKFSILKLHWVQLEKFHQFFS